MKGIILVYSVFIAVFLLSKEKLQPILSEKDVMDKEGKIIYLTYGMPMPDDYQESKIAYYNYNLRFVRVAGCMVSERLLDSLKNHNKLADKLMRKKFGDRWYDSLQAQTKREYAFDKSLISLVNGFDYVRERQQKMQLAGNGLHFMVDSNFRATIREISACGYADTNSNWVQYFLFKVDTKTRMLVSVDKKAKVVE